jgi:hypothetical protein
MALSAGEVTESERAIILRKANPLYFCNVINIKRVN